MSAATDAFVQTSKDRFLDELKSFIRIPSISTLPEHRGDIDRAASFVADSLRAAGMEHVEIIPTAKASPGLCRLAARSGQTDGPVLWPLRRPAGRSAGAVEDARLSSPRFATATSTGAARPTTKARCTCISRPSRRCGR